MRCAIVRGAGLLGAVIALAGFLAPQAAATATGKQRVLVVLGSYGSRPFTRDEMNRTMQEADAFLRRSSAGRLTLETTITPWLDAGFSAPSCNTSRTVLPDPLLAPVRAAALRAGFKSTSYSRVVYSVSGTNCIFQGAAEENEILLTRDPDVRVVVHELGHTWGLAHAAAAEHCATFCVTEAEGDLFSPMGNGFSDFSAYEKELLGWIEPQPRVSKAGSYLVVPAAAKIGRHALVVDTPVGQYWIEQRPDRKAPGLIVHVVDPEDQTWPFAATSTLLLGPLRPGHPTILPGQTFTVPGSFSVRLGTGKKTPAQLRLRLAATFR